MLRPPEKGGPSPTPDRGPLVTPACPLSANPEAAISIVGNSADLTRMMQRLLLDDTVARAVASLLPSGAQELSIRETKTTAPKGEQTNRGFSIEVPAKIRSQQLRDVVYQLALRESVVSDLSTLAATGSLPSGSHEKLSLLAKAITGQELPDESQLRAAITRCFASTAKRCWCCSSQVFLNQPTDREDQARAGRPDSTSQWSTHHEHPLTFSRWP